MNWSDFTGNPLSTLLSLIFRKNYFMRMVMSFLVLLISAMVSAQSNEEKAIRQVLTTQTQSWNHGDIVGFMQTYWKSDSLMFIGKSGITYGWQQALDRYKKNYPDATAMGKLDFTILQTRRLCAVLFCCGQMAS